MRSPQVGTAPAAVSQTANAAQVKRHAPRREILKTGYGEQPPPCRPAGGGNGEAYAARNPQQALALKRNASSKTARPAQDPASPPQGRQNADLSGQGETKKMEMEQRRKRKKKRTACQFDAALRNPNKLTRKRIRRQPPGERSYQTKGNIPPHLGEIIQTCSTDWRQKNAQAAENHKKTNMIGHARRGPGLGPTFRFELLFCCLRRIRRKTPALNRPARQTSHQNRLCFVLEENRAPAQSQA